MNTVRTALAIMLFLGFASLSHADPIELTFESDINLSTLAEIPVGSTVTTVISYDDDFISGIGIEDRSIVDQVFGTLSITIMGAFDTVTVTDADDFFATFFPLVRFIDGVVSGFDFVAPLDGFGVTGLELTTTLGGGELLDTIFIRQNGQDVAVANSIVTSQVPEPGTLTLFALGLLGIGLTQRRIA